MARWPADDALTPASAPARAAPARAARSIGRGLIACAGLTALSVAWLDRPIAAFAHARLPPRPGPVEHALQAMTRIPEALGAAAILLVICLGLLRLARGPLSAIAQAGFLASLGIIIADAIKMALKLACGRTWPETWVNNNPSFIRDGVYGFFPLHGGAGWGAFPSGHTTAVCAGMTVLWWLWPRWRALYALAVAATVIGLLGMDYHFLGDILAGGYLGWAVGTATVAIGGPAPSRVTA